MCDQIAFRIEPDDDDAFQLFVAYKGAEFTGQSSAWFFKAQLNEFAAGIATIPIESEGFPVLVGGIHEGDKVSIQHVSISVKPKGNRGILLMCLHLAEPGDVDDLDNIKRSVIANVETTYEKMTELRTGLQSLVREASGQVFVFYP